MEAITGVSVGFHTVQLGVVREVRRNRLAICRKESCPRTMLRCTCSGLRPDYIFWSNVKMVWTCHSLKNFDRVEVTFASRAHFD